MAVKIDAGALLARARNDRELAHRLRGFSGTIDLSFLDPALELQIEDGKVAGLVPASGSARVRFTGLPESWWDKAMGHEIVAGYESLTPAWGQGLVLDGLNLDEYATWFGGFARLFEVIRATIHGPISNQAPNDLFRATDNAVGRYAYVKANGQEARMYYEESGEGDVVLLMQHTAGGDARQWRHQLADPELQKRCRLIAYDLPWHGRTLPPLGEAWWEDDYSTSKEQLMNWVVGLVETLGLDRPIFMGCSIGGNLALDLACHHHDKFRGFIALNGWYCPRPHEGPSMNVPFRDPTVSRDIYAALCYNATSPQAPPAFREEIYFNYSTGFQGVFAGDNDYFMYGHDLRRDGHLMRPDLTPVYLLVGEYDGAALDEEYGGPAVPKHIPGVIYREMPGLSHFAPTDNPLVFREELFPVLDAILAR